jgi:hypothetical protein
MKETRNILLVTNATTEEEISLIKAAIAAKDDLRIKLTLVHIIPTLPTCYFNIPSTVLLAERYFDDCRPCSGRRKERPVVNHRQNQK